MSFYTAINCMDGRVQLPVIRYLQQRFNVSFVDMITDPGPNLILAQQADKEAVQSILNRIDISVNKHNSNGIAVVGHYDCAGNPAEFNDQKLHLEKAAAFIKSHFPEVELITLWVDESWQVKEV